MIFKINLLVLCMQFLLELNNAQQLDIKEILGVSGDCDFDCQGRLEDAMTAEQTRNSPHPMGRTSPHPMGRGFWGDTMRLVNGLVQPIGHFFYPKDHKVGFHLFNRNHSDKAEVVTVTNRLRRRIYKSFQMDKKTKIIIHGWNAKVGYLITRYLKRAYLSVGDFNLIMVDWSSISFWNYVYVKDQVPLIAKTVARFIDRLHKIYNLKPEDIHIIGHSLGAHIAGAAGHLITTGKIGRITGLDPANPLIDLSDTSKVLSKLSASFVDVIHTCGGHLGTQKPIGHVDFYPNGGKWSQPGCGIDVIGTCSHRRAFGYFAESIIVHQGFPSKHCSTWKKYHEGACFQERDVPMGEAVPRREEGQLFLHTWDKMPYATVQTNKTQQYQNRFQKELDIEN